MGKVKGLAVRNILGYLKEHFSRDQIEEFYSKLTESDREQLVDQPILPTTWVEYGSVLRFTAVADDVLGTGDRSLFKAACRASVEKNFTTIHRMFISFSSPRFVVARSAKVWRQYHDTGDMGFEEVKPDRFELTLTGYPDIAPHHELDVGVAMETLAHLSGAKNFAIEHTACAGRGDEHCRWEIDIRAPGAA